jgi:hypothetical protein
MTLARDRLSLEPCLVCCSFPDQHVSIPSSTHNTTLFCGRCDRSDDVIVTQQVFPHSFAPDTYMRYGEWSN